MTLIGLAFLISQIKGYMHYKTAINGKKGTGMILFPGMVFTIEPMVNQFTRFVCLEDNPDPKVAEWTIYTQDGGLSAQHEYTIVMTMDGPKILAS